MRSFTFLCLTILAALPALGADLLKQDFEGPVFPPAGWTEAFYLEYNPSCTTPVGYGYWTKRYELENPYAYSTVAVGSSEPIYVPWWCNGYSILSTPTETLNAGDSLQILFIGRGSTDLNSGNFELRLKRGSATIWNELIPEIISPFYQQFDITTPIVTVRADDYRLEFVACAYSGMPGNLYGSIEVNIDNIRIKRNIFCNTLSIQPTSLGKIKSSYK